MALLQQAPLTLTGTAQSLPAAPEHAYSLSVQPQGGDVRYREDGVTTAPTSTNGRIWYEGGVYDITGDWTAYRVIGAPGVVLDVVWRDK